MRKKEILPFATTWIDLEDTVLSEISHTEKDKHCMPTLICGIFFKKVDFIETENGGCKRLEAGGNWEMSIKGYTCPVIR